ncbi:alpha/beta fold hydrolase [Jidongwangia harbinensis]|uniref:alpha/beta fold hydrolase n=1 Tax=Jidongwangia harbinensis TaxID=2878561 RepID=UPI001CD94A0E|nr:alpha/beta hydrolase [Jidongwangia harbinensis]MCA2219292.1 alpha/beta hydrolase [Jidongwangia harbinensis]
MATTPVQPATSPYVPRLPAAARDATAQVIAAWLVVALSGVFSAAVTPRGPVTGTQVVVLITATTLVGGLLGWCVRSRWAIVAAPALHVAGWELARATVFRLDGPTFDRPRFDVTMGVILFVAVHVMYVVVAGLPMLLGVLGGRAWQRRTAGPAAVGSVVVLLVVGAIGAFLVRPGHTDPVPGGVATVTTVRLGDAEQWVSMRGDRADNPVLLHLSGGPGSSDVGWVRSFNRSLEDDFTVVVWEQRGAGKSYPALDPTTGLTLDRLVADGIELTTWLARRFHESKIYLTGNSWGSTLGVLMVQRRPDLFHAYVGTGQMVSQRETDRLLYRQLASYAVRTGDRKLRQQLAALGEPPYRDVLGYAWVMEYYDVLEPYRHVPEFDAARGLSGFFPDEYSILDTWNELRGFADMGGLVYPQIQGVDFRRDVPRLDVPVYFLQGRHELTARSRLADEWIAQLRAPVKRVYEFEYSGHNADAEEPQRYHDLLVSAVLAETYRR